jgi:hypothetical protein
MDEFFESISSWSDNQLDWLTDQVPGEILWPYHLITETRGAWAGLIPGNYRPYIYVNVDATIPSRPRIESKFNRRRMFWGEWHSASASVLFKPPPSGEQSPLLKEILAASRRSQFVSWSKDWRDCQFSDELCVPASALLDYPQLQYHRDQAVHEWETFEKFEKAAKSGGIIIPPPHHKLVGYSLWNLNFDYRPMDRPVPVPMFEPLP